MPIPTDTEPGDIFVDENGKLWRVSWITTHPTTCLEEVEGTLVDDAALSAFYGSPQKHIHKAQRSGALNCLLFEGFKVIHRPKRKNDNG